MFWFFVNKTYYITGKCDQSAHTLRQHMEIEEYTILLPNLTYSAVHKYKKPVYSYINSKIKKQDSDMNKRITEFNYCKGLMWC